MEEDIQTNIRKIITTIENEKKTYSIDVDDLTTFYEFKKILSSASHLLKNNFQIYHKKKLKVCYKKIYLSLKKRRKRIYN